MKKTLATTLALLIMGGSLSWADQVEKGLREAAARARDARDAAAAALDDARAVRDAVQALVDEALDRRDDAQLKLDASTSDEDRQRFQDMYDQAVADARAHRPKRNATVAAYRARVAELRAADAALDAARAALDAYYAGTPSVADLQAKIVALEAALKAALDELQGKDFQGKIAKLQADLKDSENALQAALQEVASARAIIAGMEAKIAELLSRPGEEESQARIAELEGALHASGLELQAALKEVESSEVEIIQLEAEILTLSSGPRPQELRAEIPRLVEALEASESNLQATLQEVESSRALIDDLDLEIRTLEGQLADAQSRVNTGTPGLVDSDSGCAVFEMSDGTRTTHDPANGIWCVSLADMHGGACLSESVNTDLRFTIDSPSGTFAGTSIHFRSGSLAYVDESASALISDAGNPAPPRTAKLRPVLLDDHSYGVNTFVKPSGGGALQFALGAGQFGAYDTGTGQFDKGGPGNQPDAPDALRDWFDNINTIVTGGFVTRLPFCSQYTTLTGPTG